MFAKYVPLLKGKRGEFRALKRVPLSKKAEMTPLFDVPRLSADSGEDPPETLDVYLRRKAAGVGWAWDCEDRCVYIDLFDASPDERTETGRHPLAAVLEYLRSTYIKAIPTTGLDRADSYQDAVATIVSTDRRGACIRILREDMTSVRSLSASLNDVVRRLGCSRGDVDLLMDFRKLESQEAEYIRNTAAKVTNGLPTISEWRSVVFAGSNMPSSLGEEIEPGHTGEIDRLEFSLWQNLAQSSLKRVLAFGDYGVVHPDIAYFDDPKLLDVSAAIRYTLPDRWLIHRGRSLRRRGSAQYHDLSRALRERPEYMGPTFSWGDEQIDLRARRSDRPGNPESWIAFGTNHHLVLVAKQVSDAVSI